MRHFFDAARTYENSQEFWTRSVFYSIMRPYV